MASPSDITSDEIRGQVARVLQSRELESSQRLQEFLKFIIDEYLAGRAGRIKGVTIAQAVFGANDSFDPESNSIVRVEAGRLRRRLSQYYLASGARDPIIIDIPKGGYAPAFQRREGSGIQPAAEGAKSQDSRHLPRKAIWVAVAALAVALVASWGWFAEHATTHRKATTDFTGPELAQSEVDVLTRQAWELLMPPEDLKRLETSIELFNHIIDLAPNRPQGYAGKSVSLSFGVLFIKSRKPESDLEIAFELAQKAVSLDDGYAVGWAAMAISQSLAGNMNDAISHARRAAADMPKDAITPTIVGLVLLNSDRPEDARELMLDLLSDLSIESRTPFLNVLGVAQYVTGDYEGAARSFETNIRNGGPWGPHLDLFLAATYGAQGQDFRASSILDKINKESPDFPVREWLGQFIKKPALLEATMVSLQDLGLESASRSAESAIPNGAVD